MAVALIVMFGAILSRLIKHSFQMMYSISVQRIIFFLILYYFIYPILFQRPAVESVDLCSLQWGAILRLLAILVFP